jgi:hypothetical protein
MKLVQVTSLFMLASCIAPFANAMGKKAPASPVQGRLEVTVWPDNGSSFSSIEFRDEGDKIVGEGTGVFSQSNGQVYLERANGALKGFVFGIPFNVSCTDAECGDLGSTDVRIALKKEADGLHYDGTLNFQFVHAVVSSGMISVTSDASFEATSSGSGNYSGSGAFDFATLDPSFDVKITSEGSLMSVEDPTVFIVTVLQAFTRHDN